MLPFVMLVAKNDCEQALVPLHSTLAPKVFCKKLLLRQLAVPRQLACTWSRNVLLLHAPS